MLGAEQERVKRELVAMSMKYAYVDYNDDKDIAELIVDTVLMELEELIPNFDQCKMTSRQKLLTITFVKELYDNREKYQKSPEQLRNAVSSILLKEIYGGKAK